MNKIIKNTYKDTLGLLLLFPTALIMGAIMDAIISFPVKWAWNYVMPYLFNLPVINWLHAFCLLFVLTSLWKIQLVNKK